MRSQSIHLDKPINAPHLRPVVVYVIPHRYAAELVVVAEGSTACKLLMSFTVDFGIPLPEVDDPCAGAGDARTDKDCQKAAALIGDIVRELQLYVPISHAAVLNPYARMQRKVEVWIPNREHEKRYLYALLEELSRCGIVFYWQKRDGGTAPRGAVLDATAVTWMLTETSTIPQFVVRHSAWPHEPLVDHSEVLKAEGCKPSANRPSQQVNAGAYCHVQSGNSTYTGIIYSHNNDGLELLIPHIVESTFVVWRKLIIPSHIHLRVISSEPVVFLPQADA